MSVSALIKGDNHHSNLELDAINLSVGQNMKNALEIRLKILLVLHHFDFKIDKSYAHRIQTGNTTTQDKHTRPHTRTKDHTIARIKVEIIELR
ncbi:hypothetical protein YC2023_051190 [Brassica napus]